MSASTARAIPGLSYLQLDWDRGFKITNQDFQGFFYVSLWIGLNNMGMLLKWSSPNQYPYEISTAYTLQFPRYGPDKIFQGHYGKVKGQIKVTLW